MQKSTKIRTAIYGGNFIVPSLARSVSDISGKSGFLDTLAASANPLGAIFFGALDIIGGLSDRIRESKFARLSKFAGAGFYGINSLLDIFSIAGGDYKSFADLVFDASMTYQLGKDTANNYLGRRDLLDDLTRWEFMENKGSKKFVYRFDKRD